MQLSVLGPLEVVGEDDREVSLALREVRILELLAAAAPHQVPTEEIIAALWPQDPPGTARNQVQGCVGRIRRAAGGAGVPMVDTTSRGYRLSPSVDLDLRRYRELARAGREAAAAGLTEQAITHLAAAMGTWRSRPFPDSLAGTRASGLSAQLRAEHLDLCELRWSLTSRTEPERAVAELERMVTLSPLRESAWGELMCALARSGKTAEALGVFARLRTTLRDALGTVPSETLQTLHTRILRGEDAGSLWAEPAGTCSNLPPTAELFVGRAALQDAMRAHLVADGERRVVALHGPRGIGRTSLAVRVAGTLADTFRDGVLYVSARGQAEEARSARWVLAELLTQTGAERAELPEDEAALRTALGRRLTGRRVLLVLDDLRDAGQVRRVLPDGPVHAVVTSLRPLPELDDALVRRVPPLTREESLDLLRGLLGAERVDGQERLALAVARACRHNPLALRVATQHMRSHTGWGLEVLLDRVTTVGQPLPELSVRGVDPAADVAAAAADLPPEAADLLPLLHLLGEESFPGWAVGALAGRCEWFDLLDQLVERDLLHDQGVDGLGQPRFVVPPLTAAVSRERAEDVDPALLREAAGRLARTWWWAVDSAVVAVPLTLHHPGVALPAVDVPAPETELDAGAQRALRSGREWLHCEHRSAMAAVHCAADHGWPELAARLTTALEPFFDYRWMHDEWEQVVDRSLEALEEGDGPGLEMAQARMLITSAQLHAYRGRYEATQQRARQALDLFERAGVADGCALAHLALAVALRETHHPQEALEHVQQAAGASSLHVRAVALSVWGGLLHRAGQHEEALTLYDRSVADATEVGDDHRLAQALRGRSTVLHALGRTPAALAEAERSAGLFDRLGDEGCLAHALRVLARLRGETGNTAGADAAHRRADALYLAVGRPGTRGPFDVAAGYR
ncbi:BTAD domain-containing putative transcriptional regulator [Kytococcus schroeteri]|nr:BTAD domain-containing putative transcriptional regulator [Kytococcus schroeteri]